MRISLVLWLLAACGGAGSPPAPASAPAAPGGPLLLGRPVATAPLDNAEQTLYTRASASLAPQLPTLEGDPDAWQPQLKSWLEQRKATLEELNRAVEGLSREARGGLFASIVAGVAMDDFVADLLALPLPPSLAAGPAGKRVEAAYRVMLEEGAAPVAATARQWLERCATLAPSAAPPLRAWADHCRTRAAALSALESRAAARPKHVWQPPPTVMEDCAGGEQVEPEPDALPPDRKVKPKLVVVYDSDDVRGADRERLLDAVTKRVRAHAKMPVLSRKGVTAGEALVAQRRMRPRGPVCGQPPRLTQVLGAMHRHLIVARVTTECMELDDDRQECSLRVAFDRAGTRERDADLPATLYAPVASGDVPATTWIAAASALSTNEPKSGILGALYGGILGPRTFSLKNYGDEDPWLRVGSTLYDDAAEKIAACVDAEASFDVTLAISPTGTTTDVALTPVTGPPDGSRVAECVRDALKATAFPCTRDGKAATIDVRMCVAPKP